MGLYPSKATSKTVIAGTPSSPVHLLHFPSAPPDWNNVTVLGLLATCQSQILIAVVATIAAKGKNTAEVLALTEALSGSGSILSWPQYQQLDSFDSLMRRAYRCIATSFTSSNCPLASLLLLREWALRCLLQCKTVQPTDFWTQVYTYMVSHAKAVKHEGLQSIRTLQWTELIQMLLPRHLRNF